VTFKDSRGGAFLTRFLTRKSLNSTFVSIDQNQAHLIIATALRGAEFLYLNPENPFGLASFCRATEAGYSYAAKET
jgi:hypothetical protein